MERADKAPPYAWDMPEKLMRSYNNGRLDHVPVSIMIMRPPHLETIFYVSLSV